MEVSAYIKYVRISPKKVKELARLTVGLPVSSAIDRLKLTSGKTGKLLGRALTSASANAVNNHKLSAGSLVVRAISVEKGPFFKRWQPVARGMAHSYKKRTSHLKIKVAEKAAGAQDKKLVIKEIKKVSAKDRLSSGQKKEK